LIERLNNSLITGCKLALISAPTGFGKSTLVCDWLGSINIPIAWLTLDERDKDPARFLAYLVAALQNVKPGIGLILQEILQSPQPLQIENTLTLLINEISIIEEKFLIVLDDYHTIDSPQVDQSLDFLIEHQPTQMHLVITTREDPGIPLARLRGRGLCIELRAADLRFSNHETAEYLNRIMKLDLSEQNIDALETRTEGWIAGLQLAAISMQGRDDVTGFIQAFTGSHRFVLDYLVEEVLLRQSEQIRGFLMQTAILDRFCAPLCDAVTERDDGKEMLEALERNNLFLIPLDDSRQWFRYHHLFTEVLQTHLIDLQSDRITTLHIRASAWYDLNGLLPDAIRHSMVAKDYERVAGLLERAWPAVEEKRAISQTAWLGWVKALPEALVQARPVLDVCYAYALLELGELEAAEARLQEAERWLQLASSINTYPETPSIAMVVVDQKQWKSLPATIAIGRAYIAQSRGNTQDTIRYANRVLEFRETNPFRQNQAALMLGMTYWASGDLKAAERIFADYTKKLRVAGNIPDAISTTVVLAEIRLALGRLQDAIRTTEQLLQYVMDQGEPISLHVADLHRELGELYLEQDQLEAAAQQFRISKELGEKAELPVWRYRWYIAQARLSVAQGDLDGAFTFLDEAGRLYIQSPLPDSRPISAMKARIWLLQGRLAQALEWAQEQGLFPDNDLNYLREYDYLTLARILIAQYQSDQIEGPIHAAMRLLDRLLKSAEEGNRLGSVIEILILQGLAHQAQGDRTSALMMLKRGLSIADPEEYVRIIIGEGPSMLTLLQEASKHRIAPRYIGKLLTGIGEPDRKKPLAHPLIEPEALIEPLSERELEVLRLLRTELSGPEIARQLIVSLNTMRTHTKNIYAKLGVNNRRAAVRRAEELNLL